MGRPCDPYFSEKKTSLLDKNNIKIVCVCVCVLKLKTVPEVSSSASPGPYIGFSGFAL